MGLVVYFITHKLLPLWIYVCCFNLFVELRYHKTHNYGNKKTS